MTTKVLSSRPCIKCGETNDYAYILARIQCNLPYTSDIANAASNTNTGVPGKYVLDLNGKLHNVCYGQYLINHNK